MIEDTLIKQVRELKKKYEGKDDSQEYVKELQAIIEEYEEAKAREEIPF